MGRIHEGLPVSFTVDALPGETFHGTVCQIRLNATSTSNVVTYTVVVATDNSDMKLLPYLTANIQFQVEKRPGVLQVPNAALRWKPRPAQVAPDVRKAARRPRREVQGRPGGQGGRRAERPAGRASRGPGGPQGSGEERQGSRKEGRRGTREEKRRPLGNGQRQGRGDDRQGPAGKGSGRRAKAVAARPAKAKQQRGQIWVKDGAYVRPINVRIGITDGSNTEIISRKVQEGMEVVVGENVSADAADDTTNPFAPKIFKGGGGGPSPDLNPTAPRNEPWN